MLKACHNMSVGSSMVYVHGVFLPNFNALYDWHSHHVDNYDNFEGYLAINGEN